jgi:hypothetical protein
MLKIAYAISLMALLACGSGDSNQGAAATGGDLPPVSAAGASTEAVLTPEAVLEDLEAGGTTAAQAASAEASLEATGDSIDAATPDSDVKPPRP